MMRKNPYDEGFEVGADGGSCDANPYKDGTGDHASWFNGYLEAKSQYIKFGVDKSQR